jgi:hypothetical protein
MTVDMMKVGRFDRRQGFIPALIIFSNSDATFDMVSAFWCSLARGGVRRPGRMMLQRRSLQLLPKGNDDIKTMLSTPL